MKNYHPWIVWAIGGLALLYLLRKPATSATWKLWTGPKFHAALRAVIEKNDPIEIAQLKQGYESWSPETQHFFDQDMRKLGLKRPW